MLVARMKRSYVIAEPKGYTFGAVLGTRDR